ncbi:FAD synthetase family protein [Alteribacillus sp. YIM 98480]|uniref:FAD synthetase family protein n=1 Tax=Alteribacillus sp. YIM 98480 TaxID=2606599 RepID=UPI00131DD490|nr:FAD synthetase family protein [Alteribacillus sp. YIM 98480]
MHIYKNNHLTLASSVVSIGAFDGLHRGHQTLIKEAAKRARELGVPSVVYTFDPPPRAHFQNTRVLTSVDEKIELIKLFDIDYVVVAEFNKEYASREALEFLLELSFLGPKEIWVGPNFQFGKGKKGNTNLLSDYFHVNVHPLVTCDKGEIISSTRIRELLQNNKRKQADHLLGRPRIKSLNT